MRSWILVAVLSLSAFTARAEILDAANYARFHGCRLPQSQAPLSINDKLQQAVRRVGMGTPLRDAVSAAQYRAAAAVMIHLTGVSNDADVAKFLTARYCKIIGDGSMREIGTLRRGREVFILVAAPSAGAAKMNAAAVSKQILEIINQARATGRSCGEKFFGPVAPLLADPALARAAALHAQDMAEHGKFDHAGSDGSTPAQRVERAGFGEHRLVGENIAAGAMAPADVAQGWLASPAHCENIMDGRFTLTGVAFAENPASASRLYWTQTFATHP